MTKNLLIFLCLFFWASVCYGADKISTIVKEADKQNYKTTLGEDNDLVIIGDKLDNVAFKNKVKFTKWNGEESLTIDFSSIVGDSFTDIDGKTKVKDKEDKVNFYYDRFDDNTFKFGIVLNEKPKAGEGEHLLLNAK